MQTITIHERPPYLAIALLSAAALGYEVLLVRLFSIIQWHHFAYMIISAALLGFGASGTLVSLVAPSVRSRFAFIFAAGAALFGVSAVGCFLAAQAIGFNPLALLWDSEQPLKLLLIYLLLLIPFVSAGSSICAAFVRFPDRVHRVYSADIFGAGLGAIGIIALLFVVFPMDALRLTGALGLAAGALALVESGTRTWAAVSLVAALALAFIPARLAELEVSPYKSLSQTLRVMGTRIIAERSSPLGLVTVVESSSIPLRHAPGMSLNAIEEPPPQLGVFTDGESFSALTRFDGDPGPLSYLDQLTSALPYHLLEKPKVLVLGAGAGAELLQALRAGAEEVDAVELNRQVVDLVQDEFALFSGKPYSARGVAVHIGEARGFVAKTDQRYDLIQIALIDSFGAAAAGLHALSESYLYTVEAFQAYLDRLQTGGVLSVTRWVSLPARDVLKLFATAIAALERNGISDPGARLALIRGWKTATLIVKNGLLSAEEIARLKQFSRERSFDLAYYPGIESKEANRYNVLAAPYFYEGAMALLGPEREDFLARYKFDLRPATDDRPYFFHFFKWSALPEFLALQRQGGLPLLEWGYPVVVATLAQAFIASLAFILLPLAIARRRIPGRRLPHWRIAFYFLAVGLAFMFIEIAYIQKFILFLAHPLYAVAVVLSGFLVFAALGSRASARLEAQPRLQHSSREAEGARANRFARLPVLRRCWAATQRLPTIVWPVFAIAVTALAYMVLLPALFRPLIGLSDPAKIAISLALLAPLAFAMGMPFPLGMNRVAGGAPELIPWAWALNGCASVVGAVLAALLGVHMGFSLIVAVAVLLYLGAAVTFPKRGE